MSCVTYLDVYQCSETSPIAETTRSKRKLFLFSGYTPLGPASSWDEGFLLARTPDRRHWVLWRQALPDAMLPRHAIAFMPCRGERTREAALTLVRETWKIEKRDMELYPLAVITRVGLLREFEIERLCDELWPEERGGTVLRIRASRDPLGWEILGEASDRLKGRATYGIETHGPHTDFARSLFDPLRTPCVPCFGTGILGLPPVAPVLCANCQGTGGTWTAPASEIAAARIAFARVYPEAVDPNPPTITGIASP